MACFTPIPYDARKRKRPESVDQPVKKETPPSRRSSDGSLPLCKRCGDIEWRDLAANPPLRKGGKHVLDLLFEEVNTLAGSTCPFCQLLARVLPPGLSGKRCRLVALSSSHALLNRKVVSDKPKIDTDCTVLFPVLEDKYGDVTESGRIDKDWCEAGCLALVDAMGEKGPPGIGPREIHSTTIDFSLLSGWLGHCVVEHGEPCKTNGGGSNSVRGLRVIDCCTRTIIDAPSSCTYFALSYVWGKRLSSDGRAEPSHPAKDKEEFPPTVADAVAVTLLLGQRYLWVDQYCIDQNDGPTKRLQMAQMDKIYSQAHLTLIAAAGVDPSYGLPGIGARNRHPQGRLVVGDVAVVQIFPHASVDLATSRWATRGWTYQEGYLSPRRLIFTDHQVCYLCNTMYSAETVRTRKQLLKHEERAANLFSDLIPGAFGFNVESNSTQAWDNLKSRQLVNYTNRDLSWPSDSLNAVLGLFHHLERSKIRHLHGIPIRMQHRERSPGLHVQFAIGWHHQAVAKRRPMFPSWSWAGWEGGICMAEPDICIPDDCNIDQVNEQGHYAPLEEYLHRAQQNPVTWGANAPQMLRIKALTVRLDFSERSWDDLRNDRSQKAELAGIDFIDGSHAVLPIRQGVTAMAYAYLDEDVPLDSEILGLVLRARNPSSRKSHTILLLRPDGPHYQRIGLVRASSFPFTRGSGERDPQVVYLDDGNLVLDKVEIEDRPPLWLQNAVEMSIKVV